MPPSDEGNCVAKNAFRDKTLRRLPRAGDEGWKGAALPPRCRVMTILGTPDGHLWTKQGEKCPYPVTLLMAIYGA
jgi:hypothetical protein